MKYYSKPSIVILTCLVFSIFLSMNSLSIGISAVPSWEKAAPLVIGDIGYAHSYNGKIYFVGSKAVQEFDPDKGTWLLKKNFDLGYQSYRGGSALIGDKIYIIHGWMNTFVYDITNNSFGTFSTPGLGRLDVGVGTAKGQLLVSGGWVGGDPTSIELVESFNPDNNTWRTINPMIVGRKHHELETADDFVYAVGGYTGSGFNTLTRVFERYNPTTLEWENLTAVPYEYRSPGMTAIQAGRIIVANITHTSVYDSIDNSWITGIPIIDSGAYYLNSLANLNNTVYSIGAIDGDGVLHGFVRKFNFSASTQIFGFEVHFSILSIILVLSFSTYRRRAT